MRVLVAYASRHGGTAEIAEEIGRAIEDASTSLGHRLEVDVRDAGGVVSVTGYDAVVLGSAVYMGKWLDGARRVVDRCESQLRAMPVWLFSSGSLGDPPIPAPSPDITAGITGGIVKRLGPRDSAAFGGRLDPERLGRLERVMTRAVKAPSGDYRDWAAIREWAATIARELVATQVRSAHGIG